MTAVIDPWSGCGAAHPSLPGSALGRMAIELNFELSSECSNHPIAKSRI
jgi:hypothetical protein